MKRGRHSGGGALWAASTSPLSLSSSSPPLLAMSDSSDLPYLSFQDSINSSSDAPPSSAASARPGPPSSSLASPISAPSYAVHVRGLSRSFGKALILHHLDLTVPSGSIYGLLGPSGCGKTTLLKVLTGRLKAHQGQVRVLDCVPGSLGSSVPGPAVGYMPQELALYEEFSVHQNFAFYGRLFAMSAAAIAERENFLLSFLRIPLAGRRIKQLSGGQQRRVSLACALLHSPSLLLLDEPTVGVDPLLRSRIWAHLRTLSSQGTTVVITTHYIEEARQADYVGFMRGGKILQEGRPDSIIAEYGSRTLEEVFLQLCSREDAAEEKSEAELIEEEAAADDEAERAEEAEVEADDSLVSLTSTSLDASALHPPHRSEPPTTPPSSPPLSDSLRSFLPRPSFLLACMWRNFTRFRNNLPALVFVFLLPSIQVILFCIAIGKVRAQLHTPRAATASPSPARALTVPLGGCPSAVLSRTRPICRSEW